MNTVSKRQSLCWHIGIALLASTMMLMSGCGSMTDSGRIVGKWQFSDTPSYWVFNSNGTFVWSQLIGDTTGTYRFENGRLKIETPGLVFGTNVMNYAYEFSGDKLMVTDGKEQVGFFTNVTLTKVP